MGEFFGLQIKKHKTLQHVVIEDQIDVKILRRSADALLARDECKPLTQFQQKRLEISNQRLLQFRFQ